MRLNPFPGRPAAVLCALALLSSGAGIASPLDALSNQDASNGLKAALQAGSAADHVFINAPAGVATSVNGGMGDDTIVVPSTGSSGVK